MSTTKNTPQTPDDQEAQDKAAPRKSDNCPDCSPGDFICKCCGISVASEEWIEDDQMCSGCLDLEPKTNKPAGR